MNDRVKMARLIGLAGFFLMTLSYGSIARAGSDFQERSKAFAEHVKGWRNADDHREWANQSRRVFEKLFSGYFSAEAYRQFSDEEIRSFFEDTHSMAVFSFDVRYARLLRDLAIDMSARGMPAKAELNRAYGALVGTRALAEADIFAKQFAVDRADWVLAPELANAHVDGKPSVIKISEIVAKRAVLSRQAIELGDGVQVIAMVSPHCGFSNNAMKFIEKDPELKARFAKRTTWVVPQTFEVSIAPLVEWNRSASEVILDLAYKNEEWEPLRSWATPIFHFFKDGKLVEVVAGWPGDAQKATLISTFSKLSAPPERQTEASPAR